MSRETEAERTARAELVAALRSLAEAAADAAVALEGADAPGWLDCAEGAVRGAMYAVASRFLRLRRARHEAQCPPLAAPTGGRLGGAP